MSRILLHILAFCIPLQIMAQVDVIGENKFKLSIEGHTLKIPYYSNVSIYNPNTTISKAVIVIHGTNRNAGRYFETVMGAADLRPEESANTVIVSPQFLKEEDVVANKLDDEHLFWSGGGWKNGGGSKMTETLKRPKSVSSYVVLDSLVNQLKTNFPSLKSLVITGHSAGGQVINRYAATTEITNIFPEDFNLSFVVANPSSYVYLDTKRYIKGRGFVVPGGCKAYNDWKFGLDGLLDYPKSKGIANIRKNLSQRKVVYLAGSNDNDPEARYLDTSCNANLQGKHRLERAQNYFTYRINYYGPEILNKISFHVVPEVGHSSKGIYTSNVGLDVIFGP